MAEPERLNIQDRIEQIRQNAKPVDRSRHQVESPEEAQDRRRRRMAMKLERWSRRLPKLYAEATLDALDENQHADEVAAWLASPSRTLFLAGEIGTGKSFSAYALGRAAAEQFQWVEAWNVVELLDELLPGAEAAVTWASVLECDLLILDDLAAAKATDWAVQSMYRIADKRVTEERRQIVTTNGTFADLVEKWGGPTMDRFAYRSATVVLTGESRRKAPW